MPSRCQSACIKHADRVLTLRRLAERGEIMLADEHGSRFAHRRHFERLGEVPAAQAAQRAAHWCVVNV
jgi:hypothetical protein